MNQQPEQKPEPLLIATLNIELTNGNSGRGFKWYSAKKRRDQYDAYLAMMRLKRTPFDIPVTVHVVRLRGPRQREWDSDSWQRGNWKELCDALVSAGWFHDDNRKWITNTTFEDVHFREHKHPVPAICIEIRPAQQTK